MKNYISKIVVLSFLSIFSAVIFAQQISIPFACGFEDSLEIKNNWNINAGPDGLNCTDKWMVGNLDYNEGYNSLYISCDIINLLYSGGFDMDSKNKNFINSNLCIKNVLDKAS